jgi:mRNA interferase RelE/StbE
MTEEAVNDLKRLDKQVQQRIRERLWELSVNPFDRRISKSLRVAPKQRASRVGDWRVLYEVDEVAETVDILAVRHRGKAYVKI